MPNPSLGTWTNHYNRITFTTKTKFLAKTTSGQLRTGHNFIETGISDVYYNTQVINLIKGQMNRRHCECDSRCDCIKIMTIQSINDLMQSSMTINGDRTATHKYTYRRRIRTMVCPTASVTE